MINAIEIETELGRLFGFSSECFELHHIEGHAGMALRVGTTVPGKNGVEICRLGYDFLLARTPALVAELLAPQILEKVPAEKLSRLNFTYDEEVRAEWMTKIVTIIAPNLAARGHYHMAEVVAAAQALRDKAAGK